MPSYLELQGRLSGLVDRPLLMTPGGAERLALMLQGAIAGHSRLDGRGGMIAAPSAAESAAQNLEPPAPNAYCPMWMGEPDDELDWGVTLKDGIASISIDTAIDAKGWGFWSYWWHGYDTLHAAISGALEDPRVEGLFIHMDSPGGVVHDGIFTLTELLRESRSANGGKPIHVHGELIASAAYWIASQADRITSSRTGSVGSIGAVMLHTDVSGAMEKYGIKVTPIQGGARKTEFASFKELDEEAQFNLQAMIDQVYRDFVGEVITGRPSLTEDELYETEARLFDARNDLDDHSGLAHGLIDAIESEEEAFEHLRSITSRDTPAAGATPTTGSQSRGQIKETAMSAIKKALAALSGNGKATERIATAIGLLPPGNAARGILLASGSTANRIARAKLKLAEQMDDPDAEDPEMDEDPDVEGDDPNAEDDPDAEGDDPDAEGDDPNAEDDPDAEGDDPEAEGDDPDAEDEKMARAEKIINLKSAKGREAMAQKLAFMKNMTVRQADSLLKAAPRGSRRSMTDPDLSAGGGSGAGAKSPDQRLVASAQKIAQRARR